jgi:hypothetical protein
MVRRKELATNDVLRLYSRKRKPPKRTTAKLNRGTVLIEGIAPALELLGQLILAHSRAGKYPSCHLSLHPKSAGSARFTKESTLGSYLHKLPCSEGSILDDKLTKKRKQK